MIYEIVMNSGLLFFGSNILIGIFVGIIEICSRIQELERNMKMNWKGIGGIEAIILMLSVLGGFSTTLPSSVQHIILGVGIVALFVGGNVMDS